ncbi:MAG: cytochrome P450 [Rhodobacteraceae bacterium]|nr:MAG: cytochrome P450 [Paracoccaceae bacterium]
MARGEDSRDDRAMDDALFTPDPAPPPLDWLERHPVRAKWETLKQVWRSGRNLLHIFHPEAAGRPYVVANLGTLRLITVNDADFARQVLSERADRYVKSHMYQAMLGDFLGRTASLISDGPGARAKRRLLGPAFNARALKRLEGVVERHVRETLDGWAALGPGAEIDIGSEAPTLAMRIAMEAFFSTALGPRAERFAALLDDLMADAGSPSMADVMDLPRWVPRRSRRGVAEKMAEIDRYLLEAIDARLARRGEGPPDNPDMLDLLVHATDPETGAHLPRVEVRNEVVTLFMAGHETTALSLVWGFDRLARERAAQDRLAAAVQAARAAKGGPLACEDMRGIPLVGATYDEILRLYPPGYVVARTAVAEDSFGDLSIRPGDRFQIAIFMLHRNPRYWARAGAFEPDRFLDRTVAGARHPFAFIPFGGGPRLCIGLAVARMEAHLLIAETLARFRLSPVGAPPKPDGKITLRTEDRVRVRLDPRAPVDAPQAATASA